MTAQNKLASLSEPWFDRAEYLDRLGRIQDEVAARQLGLALTSRDKKTNPIPMAGFPHHQLDGYLGKLVQSGFRVAVCEQVQDPREATGLVHREVTRIVTPGTVTDDSLLEPKESNYLMAVVSIDNVPKPKTSLISRYSTKFTNQIVNLVAKSITLEKSNDIL